MVNRLFLVGYRGTGKTTIGQRVARLLGKSFVDTDDIIVRLAGKPIEQIFSTIGEAGFRDYEERALKEAISSGAGVIACGGGIVVRENNRSVLKREGLVFLLQATPKKIFNRIYGTKRGGTHVRPALTNLSPLNEIKQKLSERAKLYNEVATFKINSNNSVDYCVRAILRKCSAYDGVVAKIAKQGIVTKKSRSFVRKNLRRGRK